MITFACKDIEFRELLRCSFELNKTQYSVLMFLIKEEKSLTAAAIGKRMGKDRTTVQKAIKRLAEIELAERRQENLGKGGCLFHYTIKNKLEIKSRMEKIVERWHQAVLTEIKRW